MFAVLGCCYCLCTMGGESATPGIHILSDAPCYMDHVKWTIFQYNMLIYSILYFSFNQWL